MNWDGKHNRRFTANRVALFLATATSYNKPPDGGWMPWHFCAGFQLGGEIFLLTSPSIESLTRPGKPRIELRAWRARAPRVKRISTEYHYLLWPLAARALPRQTRIIPCRREQMTVLKLGSSGPDVSTLQDRL